MVVWQMRRDFLQVDVSSFDFIYETSTKRAFVMIFQTAEFPVFGENVDVKIIWSLSL